MTARPTGMLGRRGAAFLSQARIAPLPQLATISLLAYAVLAVAPTEGALAALCGSPGPMATLAALLTLPWAWGLGPLAADWTLMVVAMMTPLVTMQVARIGWACGAPRAPIAIAAFLGAYWLTWIVAALPLLILAVGANAALGNWLAPMAALASAAVYSASPLAGWARNRCHRTDPVPAFGARSIVANLAVGFRIGGACVAACWPWMLVPLTIQSGHFVAMATVGAYLFLERIAPPAKEIWRLPPGVETLLGPVRPTPLFRGR